MNIEARKIALVKQILSLENELLIKELEAKLMQLLPSSISSLKNKKPKKNLTKKNNLNPPITKIRENISLDKIVAEQKTTPISYNEIQTITKKTKWNHSLETLLEALN